MEGLRTSQHVQFCLQADDFCLFLLKQLYISQLYKWYNSKQKCLFWKQQYYLPVSVDGLLMMGVNGTGFKFGGWKPLIIAVIQSMEDKTFVYTPGLW